MKVKLFYTTCVTILLYGFESWVLSHDMESKINAFATFCYRIMLNIKRKDYVPNTMIFSMTNTEPLIHHVQNRQLRFPGHILRLPEEEPASRYALYIPPHGNRKPGRPHTFYLSYIPILFSLHSAVVGVQRRQCRLQADQIAMLAKDQSAWRNFVVACSAAEGWWWWWWQTIFTIPIIIRLAWLGSSISCAAWLGSAMSCTAWLGLPMSWASMTWFSNVMSSMTWLANVMSSMTWLTNVRGLHDLVQTWGVLSGKVGTRMCSPDTVLLRPLRFTNGSLFIWKLV